MRKRERNFFLCRSLTRCWNIQPNMNIIASLMDTPVTIRFRQLVRIRRKSHSYVCLEHLHKTHALQVVQCTYNIPAMYAQYFLRHGGKISRGVHGRFFHLWRFLLRMPSPSQSGSRSMQRKESDIELGEVPLYGPTRHCFGSYNLQERELSGQSKHEFDSSSPASQIS